MNIFHRIIEIKYERKPFHLQLVFVLFACPVMAIFLRILVKRIDLVDAAKFHFGVKNKTSIRCKMNLC